MQPDAAALLWDVHEAAMKIGRFTAGLDERSYSADDLRRSLVERLREYFVSSMLPAVRT
jgi:hypothetical protein